MCYFHKFFSTFFKKRVLCFVFVPFFVSCSNSDYNRADSFNDIRINDTASKMHLVESPAIRSLKKELLEKQDIFLISKNNTYKYNKIVEIPISNSTKYVIREKLYNALKNMDFLLYKVASVENDDDKLFAGFSDGMESEKNEFISAKNSMILFDGYKNNIFIIKIGKTSLILNRFFECNIKDSIFLILTNYIIVEFSINNIDNMIKYDVNKLSIQCN